MPIIVLRQLIRPLIRNVIIKREYRSLIFQSEGKLSINIQKLVSKIRQNQTSIHSKHILFSRHSLIAIIKSMNTDNSNRGIADGAEQLANDQLLASGIASVQVGVGTVADKSTQQRVTKQWSPDPHMMSALTSMGISGVAAKKALFYTDNQSVEMATNWIFENPDNDLDTPLELELNVTDLQMSAVGAQRTPENSCNEVYKMVFIVNSSLEMGVGKIAAQVAHAALGMHQILLQDESKFGESLIRWFEFGETKIVLRGDSTQHLIELEKKALELGLPTYLVQDAGKTQVKSGSTTVLCLYGQTDRVDSVSGRLRLL